MITATELQSRLPGAELFNLNTEAHYLILCDTHYLSIEAVRAVTQDLLANGIHITILLVDNAADAVRVMEMTNPNAPPKPHTGPLEIGKPGAETLGG